jgi:hypothetical protein
LSNCIFCIASRTILKADAVNAPLGEK